MYNSVLELIVQIICLYTVVCVNCAGNPVISMVLSAFSHFNLWHIGANMYVLWSFANVSLNLFGKEQWLAVYLSSGEELYVVFLT